MEAAIERIIREELDALDRPDLYREPLVSFSDASDSRYIELKKIIGEWHLAPTELLPDAKSVISYFIPFTRAVAGSPRKADAASPLWGEAYQEINRHFNLINSAVATWLENQGYEALTIKPTHTYDPRDLKCKWSHRSAAVIAGLGEFGANRLVITDKGSAGRFCSIITSAPLRAQRPRAATRCTYMKDGSCGACFKVCPARALKPEGLEKFICQELLFKNERGLKETAGLSSADVCGKCISACPYSYIE